MKLLICGLLLCLAVSSSSADRLDDLLDLCLNPRRDEAVFILNAEITACGDIWSSAIQPLCINIARQIIITFIDDGVECVKTLPIQGLTDDMISQIVNNIEADVNQYIDAAESKCIGGASSISNAVECFAIEVRGYAEDVVQSVKTQAHGFPLIY